MNTESSLFHIEDLTVHRAAKSFNVLFNNMDSGYLITDTNHRVLFFNNTAEDWFQKHHSIQLQRGVKFIHDVEPEKRTRVTKAFDRALAGEKVNYEFAYKDESGSDYWFMTRMFGLTDENEKVQGVCIYIADINERKRSESELRRTNERYNYVSRVTSDAIWDWGLHENVLYFNNTYKTLFGMQETDFTNDISAWENRIHPDDRDRVVKKINAVLQHGKLDYWEDEYRYAKYDGSYAYVYDRGHVIFDENGTAVRMVGAMQDITARKLYEIEREKITADLIQRNQDLEQFAFIVSHNLRSHIANILGLSELVNSGLLAADEKDSIFKTLNISAKKLDGVIKDLSLILQVKRDINEKKQRVQFTELVHDVQVSLHNHIEKEQAEIITNFRAADNIYSVKSYLYSVIHNLISNSLKYRKGNVAPVIKLYSEQTDDTIILKYKDNGLGIDMHANGHNVFGLYKRFHTNTEGKGMGLFMVKTQVEALGGTIDLRSSPNEGVEFRITFNKTEN